jgi:hypothetical protein
MTMTEEERWADPKQRKIIEDAVHESVSGALKDDEKNKQIRLRFLLWCTEGTPWEMYTKNHVADSLRAKSFFDHVPRFV